MGYRSNVLIVLKDDVEMNSDVKRAFEDCGLWIRGKRDGCTLYIRNQIKWYDVEDYHHVFTVCRFLNGLDESSYRFLRIGDEYDDIRTRGRLNDPFHACIERRFAFDLPECEDELN
jgi:hypothetical protein